MKTADRFQILHFTSKQSFHELAHYNCECDYWQERKARKGKGKQQISDFTSIVLSSKQSLHKPAHYWRERKTVDRFRISDFTSIVIVLSSKQSLYEFAHYWWERKKTDEENSEQISDFTSIVLSSKQFLQSLHTTGEYEKNRRGKQQTDFRFYEHST